MGLRAAVNKKSNKFNFESIHGPSGAIRHTRRTSRTRRTRRTRRIRRIRCIRRIRPTPTGPLT